MSAPRNEKLSLENPHKYSHDDRYISALEDYDLSIKLAIRSGATTPKDFINRVPNGRCQMKYFVIKNIFHPLFTHRTDYFFWCDSRCDRCSEQRFEKHLRENQFELNGVVALLRTNSYEIIMRKDWSWALLREDSDTSMLAVYSREQRQPFMVRLLIWYAHHVEGSPKYSRVSYYLEDLLSAGCKVVASGSRN